MNKVPYIVVESIIASHERTVKRLCTVIILLIAVVITSNVAWIYYENGFTDTTTIEQDATTEGEDSSILQNVNGYGSMTTDGTRIPNNN